MTADISATLQTYTEPQYLQAASTSERNDSQPGIFSALIDAVSDAGEILEQLPQDIIPNTEGQVMTFSGNNTLARSVIDILAGETDDTEILLASDEPDITDEVIWPDNEEQFSELGRSVNKLVVKVKEVVAEKIHDDTFSDTEFQELAEQVITEEGINDLSEEMRKELAIAVNDIAASLKQDDGQDTQPVVKMLGEIADRIIPQVQEVSSKSEDVSEGDDNLSELPEVSIEFAGLANVLNTFQPQEQISRQEHAVSSVQAHQPRSHQAQQSDSQQLDESPVSLESQPVAQTYREALDTHGTQQEAPNSGQDQPGTQSQGQGHSNPDSHDSPTRTRTNSPKTIDSRANSTDTGKRSTAEGIRQTDSHTDFAAYFEGVLSTRRTSTRTSATPLDLRTTQNFTQATTLRDGLVNVVRFIRADGVQKARVVVDPPALGRISIELTNGTSGVEASIKVSSEQIRQLVQDQLSQLRMNLSQQGVQVAEFTVDVQQDNSGSQQGQQQNTPYMNSYFADDDDETEEFRVDLEDGLLYWVA